MARYSLLHSHSRLHGEAALTSRGQECLCQCPCSDSPFSVFEADLYSSGITSLLLICKYQGGIGVAYQFKNSRHLKLLV